MSARIFRPAPNAMQSGRANSRQWVLLFEAHTPKQVEPLMGYTSTADTKAQVRLCFDTLDEAEAFARREGIAYSVLPEHNSRPKKVSYTDNFRHDRRIPWTH